jgi:TolB-like protein/class 3 adenylate cyclase
MQAINKATADIGPSDYCKSDGYSILRPTTFGSTSDFISHRVTAAFAPKPDIGPSPGAARHALILQFTFPLIREHSLSGERVERRLAAVFVADVAGYSRLMGADEVGTLASLKAHRREVIDPAIASHRGRMVKTTGDGLLVEFASAVDAVTCAMSVQRTMAERNAGSSGPHVVFRIGINVGDVIVDGDDIFGDGVNVAARVENECEPGGVSLSATAFDQVRDKTPFTFSDLGEKALKNIDRPVHIYAAKPGNAASVSSASILGAKKLLPLPDKPSIAVLPFQNMSGDPEQDYFADGLVEELITGLSRIGWLFVIARNSSFIYKGRAVDVKEVGRELGVRYIVEGSVRKAAERVRITCQLIDTATGMHLWADRLDGRLDDIFDLQDQVTASVVGVIAPKLQLVEIERSKLKPTDRLDAYDYFLRGIAKLHEGSRAANDEALRLFYRAIELDPQYASASGMAAYCYVWRRANGWMTEPARELAEAARLATRAVELGRDDPVALCWGGFALARVLGDLDRGGAFIERALVLSPNLAAAWGFSGRVKVYRGEPDLAIEHLARAMRLSPRDAEIYGFQGSTAYAHFFAGRYQEASSWAETAMRENANFLPVTAIASASLALAGQMDKAKDAMQRLRQIDPRLRISTLQEEFTFRRVEDMARLAEGLRTAGLPE